MYIHWLNAQAFRKISTCNFNMLPSAAQQLNRSDDHTHCLIYVLDGAWEITQNGMDYTLQANDMLFLFAGTRTFERPCFNPGTTIMFLYFNADEADRLISVDSTVPEGGLCLPGVRHCVGEIASLFRRIIYLFYSQQVQQDIKLHALLLELLCELSQPICAKENPSGDRDPVSWSIYRIRTSPQQVFTADELAQELFMSAQTLNKQFLKVTGKTVYRFQLETRLEMARELLMSEQAMPLHEIALLFGFCDEYHFSKQFKNRYRISPSAFRSQMQ